MAEKKDTTKVKDFSEPTKEFSGLVKENFLNGFDFTLSLWEENVKALNTQVDYWLNVEKDFLKTVREFYSKFPKELNPSGNGNAKLLEAGSDRIVAFQKEYTDIVKTISDKLTKETRSLTQKNMEKAFSLLDDYLNTFRV